MLNRLYEMLNNKYDVEYYDETIQLYFGEKGIHIWYENNEGIEVYLYDNEGCDESKIFTVIHDAYSYIDNFLEN